MARVLCEIKTVLDAKIKPNSSAAAIKKLVPGMARAVSSAKRVAFREQAIQFASAVLEANWDWSVEEKKALVAQFACGLNDASMKHTPRAPVHWPAVRRALAQRQRKEEERLQHQTQQALMERREQAEQAQLALAEACEREDAGATNASEAWAKAQQLQVEVLKTLATQLWHQLKACAEGSLDKARELISTSNDTRAQMQKQEAGCWVDLFAVVRNLATELRRLCLVFAVV